MFCLTIYERDVYILFDADARVSLHVISNKIIKFSLVFSFFLFTLYYSSSNIKQLTNINAKSIQCLFEHLHLEVMSIVLVSQL